MAKPDLRFDLWVLVVASDLLTINYLVTLPFPFAAA